MSDTKRCEQCGSPLPQGGILGGRCPLCLGELGFGSTSGVQDYGVASGWPGATRAAEPPAAIGRYKILRLIGEGGMGTVYEAEQEHPRRMVALKIIKPGRANPELIQRFEQESQALGRLQHSGIAQIYEAGTADTGFGPQPYFAMELVIGETPRDYVRKRNLNVRGRLELMAKVADAVHHAHQRGLIHRDLKPSNILVDETGQPKVLDFGVARVIDKEADSTLQTDLGQLVGTLAYMSPEQVAGDSLDIDIRTDVYALGVLLYELLAGRHPYHTGGKLPEAIQAIREADAAPLATINRMYKGDIETIAFKALEKDKTRRYTSSAELAADIRRYLKDEPIIARPPSTSYQLQKFAQRHRALVTGVSAAFVFLIAGVVASMWQADRARRAESAAVLERDRALRAESNATSAEETARTQRDLALRAGEQATSERNRAISAEEQARQDRDKLLWQSLARESIRHSAGLIDDDRAALLARQAMIYQARTPNQAQFLVEDALQKAARKDTWSHVLFRGTENVMAVAFSTDGTHLAAGGMDKIVRVWDMRDPSAAPLLLRHDAGVSSVMFSPDGRRLVSGSGDRIVRVWDLQNPTAVPVLFRGHVDAVISVAFSSDGVHLASGAQGTDKIVRVWDMRDPSAAPLLFPHDGAVFAVAFSPDGTHLAAGAAGSGVDFVRMWDIRDPNAAPILLHHQGGVTEVAFSRDGKHLASGGVSDNAVRVWDLMNLQNPPVVLQTSSGVSAIAFSPDGARLASGGYKSFLIWDLKNAAALPVLLEGHQDRVDSVAFSPDGAHLASSSWDKSVRVWDLRNNSVPMLLSPGTFVPQRGRPAQLPDSSITLLLPAGRTVAQVVAPTPETAALAFSPDASRLASGGNDPNVRVWNVCNPDTPPVLFQGSEGAILSVAFSPDGRRLASGGSDSNIRLWDPRNPSAPPVLLQGHQGSVLSVAFSSDGKHLASASSDSTVRIWDLRNPHASVVLLRGGVPFFAVAFSTDLTRLASISSISDKVVRVWDLRNSGAPPLLLEGPTANGPVTSLAFSPDGTSVASTGAAPRVRVWNLRKPTNAPLSQGQERVVASALAFSSDSERLAFTSIDGNRGVQLWDLRNPEEPPLLLTSPKLPLTHSLAFSPNGAFVASLEKNSGRVVLWRLWSEAADDLCTRVWRNLTKDEWRLYVGDNIPYERTCPSLPPGTEARN